MANRYDIIRIDFQASARGANTAIESIRKEAEDCNTRISELKKNIAEAPKNGTGAKVLEGWNEELKATEKRFKQFNTAYKELVKGMRALDEGVKMFNDGSLQEMNAAFQKTVNNAAKLAQSKLKVGTDEWRQMGALMQETEQNYARMQRDTDQLIESLQNGGTVFRKTLEDEKKGLQDLLQVLPYMGTEYRKAQEQLDFLVKKTDEMIVKERQMKGEIVTTDDARRVSLQLTKEGAEAARQRAAAADEEIEKGKQVIATLEKEQEVREKDARESAQAAATYRENQRMYEDEIERLDKEIKRENDLANSKKNGTEALRKKAEQMKASAEDEKKTQQELDGAYDAAKEKAAKLREEVEKMRQGATGAPSKDSVAEAVKTGAEEASEAVKKETDETKKKTEAKKEEAKAGEKVVETQNKEKVTVDSLLKSIQEQETVLKGLREERDKLAASQKQGAQATKEEANAFKDLTKEQAQAMLEQKQALATFKNEGGQMKVSNREEAQRFLFDSLNDISGKLGIEGSPEKVNELLSRFKSRYGLQSDDEAMSAVRGLMSGGLVKSGFMNKQFLTLEQDTANISTYKKGIEQLTAVINGETKATEENVEAKRTLADIDADIAAKEKEQRESVILLRRLREGEVDVIDEVAQKNGKLAESHRQNTEAIKKQIEAIKQMNREQAETLKKEMMAKSTLDWKAGKPNASNLEELQHWIITQAGKKGTIGEDGKLTLKGQNIDKLLADFHKRYGTSGDPSNSADLFKQIIKGGSGLFDKGGSIKGENLTVNINKEAYDARLEKFKAIFDITNKTANATKKSTDATKDQTNAIDEQLNKVEELKRKWEEAKAEHKKYNDEYNRQISEIKRLKKGSFDEQLAAEEKEAEAETYKETYVDPAYERREQYKRLHSSANNKLKRMQTQGQETDETKKNTEAENNNAEATESATKSKRGKKKASEEAAKATGEETQKSAELITKEKELEDAETAEATAKKNAEEQQKRTTKAINDAEAAVTKADEAEKKHVETTENLNKERQENVDGLKKLNEANKDTIATNEKNQKLLDETNGKIREQGEKIRDAERIKAQANTEGIEKTEQAIRLLTEENRRIGQNSSEWEENTRIIQRLQAALDEMKNKPALMMMTDRMQDVSKLSTAAVSETRKFWEAMVAGAERGSKELAEYEGHLKTITEEEQKRSRAALEQSAKRLNGNLGNLSQDELRQAINDAKLLQSTYKSTSKEAQELAQAIVNAEDHVRRYGVEAERTARKQEEADKKAARAARDKEEADRKAQQEQHTMMQQRAMLERNRTTLSAAALAETKKYWQAVKDGAEEGSVAQRNALRIMEKITAEEQRRNTAANAKKAGILSGTLTNYSEGEIREAIEAGKQLILTYKSGSEEAKKMGEAIAKAEEHIKNVGLDAQRTAVRQEQAIAKIREVGAETLQRAQNGEFATASMDDLDKTIKKLKEYQALIKDPNNEGKEAFEATKEQVDALTEQLNKLKGVAEKVKGSFKDADEVLARFGEHMNAGKTASEGMAQSLDEKLAGKTSSYDEDIERNIKNLERYEQEIQEATQELADMEKELAELEAKHKNSSWFRKKTKAYQQEGWRIEDLRDEIEGHDAKMDDGSTFRTGLKARIEWLQGSKQGAQEMVDYWKKAKAFELGITEETEEKKQDAQRLTQEQMQEGIKLLEEEYRKTDHTTEEGIKKRERLRQTIDQMNQEIKESTGEWMSYAEAEELASKAGTSGFFATSQQMQQATQAIERQRDAMVKTIQQKQRDGEATKKEEEELQRLEKVLKDLKFEQDNFNMSHKQMEDLLKHPKKADDLDQLKAAIKRADGELHHMKQSLGDNNDQYRKFAAEVKAAKNELKLMEGQAKATTGQLEKAWSRLKTYVGLYMGFNMAWQKFTGTIGDMKELSDRMGEVGKTTQMAAGEIARMTTNLSKLDTRTALTSLVELSAKAGQLGLKSREDVEGFTEAANKMLVALPEMGADGATQMMKVALATGEVAKIQKEMDDGLMEGSSATAVAMEKIASTIDQLRANSAAAAPAITDFVKRVGAVGAQSGISIDQVAALGSTVDALGLRVEMSATALSRMIPAIKANAFEVAKAIGMAPEALRAMFDEAGGGMNAMLAVFQHIKDSGMDADSIENMLGMGGMRDIMKDLNQQGARAGIVFAGLSQNVDVLREHLGIAKTAYEENIAIQQEYDRMNETTAAKWERLGNQIEEMFVGPGTQSVLGDIADALRVIVDLVSGPLNTAFWATSAAVLSIKSGLTSLPEAGGKVLDYLRESAAKAGEALQEAAARGAEMSNATKGMEQAADAVDDIGDALEGAQEAGEQAGEAMETATGAIAGMNGATKVSIFSVNGLKMAWKGLDATMKANIIVAVTALLWTLGKAIYNIVTEVYKHNKAVADANAMIQIATDRFEGYWQKLKDTKTALDDAKKSTDGLKEGSDELTKATVEVTKADNNHRAAIADINGIYGKYLGFMLTETNYANLAAAAHDKITAAIRREMLAKQEQAAIDQVTQENTENLKGGLANLTEELRESGRLDSQQAAQAKQAVQEFMRKNIKYNADKQDFDVSESAYKYLQSKGANRGKLQGMDANKIAAAWFYEYLKDTFHLGNAAVEDITGVYRQGGGYGSGNIGGRNFRGDYASAYLDNMKDVADIQDVFRGERTSAESDDKKSTQALVKRLQKQAKEAQAKITNKGTSDKERNKAYEDLANSLEGLDTSIDQLNPMGDKELVDSTKKLADDISKSVDKDKLMRARTNARSIFARATGGPGGESPLQSLDPTKNPWGSNQPAESTDWKNMTAEQLVNRRKQMKDFVNAIQTDTDVQSVLKEDAALKAAIEKGMSADMRTVIEWYNTERLKIQDELHARHLTNTGDWMDPKKQKNAHKQFKAELDAYLEELDAYYTERKAEIEKARSDEEITEGEAWRRNLKNENEWYNRRAELLKLYAEKSGDVTQAEQDAIVKIIAERTGDSVEFVRAMIKKTIGFAKQIEASGEKGAAMVHDWYAKIDLKTQQSMLKSQQAITKQVKFIEDTLAKERPYDGITKNLQENLDKMGVLAAKMRRVNDEMTAQGKEPKYSDAEITAQTYKEMAFYLRQAEDAWSIDINELLRRMAEEGMTTTAEEISKSDMLKQAVMGQLRKTFEEVQNAVKKEASQIKKDVDIIWNDDTRGPGGMSMKATFDKAIARLGMQQDSVSRANGLIGAGMASDNVAARLAMKQIEVQMRMQKAQYDMYRVQASQRITALKAEAAEHERIAKQMKQEGNIMEAERENLAATNALRDAENVKRSLGLTLAEETKKEEEQKAELLKIQEESQNRLYTDLKSWADLLTSSLQGLFEASHAGDREYYNERAKMDLTGNGGPGAGTYIVIDNEGTDEASAHYEYLNQREALERQREIENDNAVADAWKKMMDDLNQKMSETITDQLNAMLQSQSIDANTQAVIENTRAIYESMGQGGTPSESSTPRQIGPMTENDKAKAVEDMTELYQASNEIAIAAETEKAAALAEIPGYTPSPAVPLTDEQIAAATEKSAELYGGMADLSDLYTNKFMENQAKMQKSGQQTDKQMAASTQSAFAKMTQAANLYGIAYQAMSNDNLSTMQKFGMMAVQAAGQSAITALTVDFSKTSADAAMNSASVLGKLWSQLGWYAVPVYALFTGLLGGMMGLAASKIAKSKSEISQATGASMNAGRLSTGMMTYAEGNVNEFTDPATLTPGRSYNVDGADGRTYRAKYTGTDPKTHITSGPEFHLVGERGPEAIIDAKTTRQIRMDDNGIWQSIQTLYNGGRLSASRRRRSGMGVRAFADGNMDEFEDIVSGTGTDDGGASGMGTEQMAAFQSSLDRNNELLERALTEGIHARFDVYGKGGLIDSYDTGKKTVSRHGEKF